MGEQKNIGPVVRCRGETRPKVRSVLESRFVPVFERMKTRVTKPIRPSLANSIVERSRILTYGRADGVPVCM
jgi:hypothetical protein